MEYVSSSWAYLHLLGSDPSENDKVYRMLHASMALRLETAILAPQCNNYKKPEKRQSYMPSVLVLQVLKYKQLNILYKITGSYP